jgi:beta-lactamase superfamily II metal-dependent hydrolase
MTRCRPLLHLLVLAANLCSSAACRGAVPASAQPVGQGTRLRVDFIDVGHGDAALITSPSGKTVLIDGGDREAGRAVVRHLRERRVGPLDLVLASHPHADHIGGLIEVIAEVGARAYMDAPSSHDSRIYRRLLGLIEERGIPVREAVRGRGVELGGGARLTLLGPPEPRLGNGRSAVNANSVVARLDFGKVSVLFTGDAEAETETWLLETGAPLAALVLKVAHHGSKTSSRREFLAAVRPRLAVISTGSEDGRKPPDGKVVERLERLGVRVLRTDLHGSIAIETDGATLELQVQGRRESISPGIQGRRESISPGIQGRREGISPGIQGRREGISP